MLSSALDTFSLTTGEIGSGFALLLDSGCLLGKSHSGFATTLSSALPAVPFIMANVRNQNPSSASLMDHCDPWSVQEQATVTADAQDCAVEFSRGAKITEKLERMSTATEH
jgi:hypothetical protein